MQQFDICCVADNCYRWRVKSLPIYRNWLKIRQLSSFAQECNYPLYKAESTQHHGAWVDIVVTRYDCTIEDIGILCILVLPDHGFMFIIISFTHEISIHVIRHNCGWQNLPTVAILVSALQAVPICNAFLLHGYFHLSLTHSYQWDNHNLPH